MSRAETLGGLLSQAATAHSNKTALICGARHFTFAELDQLADRLCGALRALGIARGDRVTLYSQNCWEWIVSYYAIARLGAVCNPINMMLTPEEVAFVVEDCEAKAILASRDKGAALLNQTGGWPVDTVVLFGGDALPNAHAFESLIQEPRSATPGEQAIDPAGLACILYTSGTTGHPKGAMLSHRNLLFNAAMTATMHVRTAADVVVTALPMPHVYGSAVLNAGVMAGATLVLLERFAEAAALEAIQRHRATMFEGVPTMYMYLLNHPGLREHDISSLTRCTVGGQTMPVAKMQEVEDRFGCKLLELWGMTEIAGLGTTHAFYSPGPLGSIGLPLPQVECRIADIDDVSRSVPCGEVGELVVRGPIVMSGYYGNPSATADTIDASGWLRTGDLARMDADGYVFVVDRKKDMIITAGYNVYPAEIERVLAGHPAIAMVAVGSRSDELKGEVAKAYVVLKHGSTVDEQTLLSFCRQHLAAYKVPRAVQFVPDLPKTSTGKILRRRLAALDEVVQG
jgi:long-chain acyl-CoA synthetase